MLRDQMEQAKAMQASAQSGYAQASSSVKTLENTISQLDSQIKALDKNIGAAKSAADATARTVPLGIDRRIHRCVRMVVTYVEAVCRGVCQDVQLFRQTVQVQRIARPPIKGDIAVALGRVGESFADIDLTGAGGPAFVVLGRNLLGIGAPGAGNGKES